jgi:hypothetical protein
MTESTSRSRAIGQQYGPEVFFLPQDSFEAFVGSIGSVSFEEYSKWDGIEPEAFWMGGLMAIDIPASDQGICEKCFSECKSLQSFTIEHSF